MPRNNLEENMSEIRRMADYLRGYVQPKFIGITEARLHTIEENLKEIEEAFPRTIQNGSKRSESCGEVQLDYITTGWPSEA